MRSEQIIEALLGDEDEDAGLAKELTYQDQGLEQLTSHDLAADSDLQWFLARAVQSKERYLGRKCVKTMRGTNPQGETYYYGKFGVRRPVISTLLYLDPEEGWQRVEERLKEDIDDEDFKEVYGQPEHETYLPLGTISHATMQTDHLLPRFLDALETVDPERAAKLRAEAATVEEDWKDEFLWETVADALEKHTPPYTYFGSHPGDGADYGVWISDESITDDIEGEELRTLRRGEQFLPGDTDYVVVVDESGAYEALLNGTTGRVIWRI